MNNEANNRYQILYEASSRVPVKAWTVGVPFDDNSRRQLLAMAQMPFIYRWIAVMPDVHLGKGATIGSVIPTLGAVIPAAVGVDVGCGMMATRTSLTANDLPDNLEGMHNEIEQTIPHGRSKHIRRGSYDKGSWRDAPATCKPIEQVMEAQKDLVEIVHTLKQVVCVKG